MIPCCILGPDLEGSSSSHLFFLFSPDIKSKVNQQNEIGDLKAFVSFQQQNTKNTNKKEQRNWSIGTAKWWFQIKKRVMILYIYIEELSDDCYFNQVHQFYQISSILCFHYNYLCYRLFTAHLRFQQGSVSKKPHCIFPFFDILHWIEFHAGIRVN